MSTSLLDCGHAPTPTEDGLGTGTAYTPDGKRSMCYPCATREQREYVDTHDSFGAYVSSDGNRIETWNGDYIAHATRFGTTSHGWHGSAIYSWQATRNGRVFYGRNGGKGMCIIMRAYKAHRVETTQ